MIALDEDMALSKADKDWIQDTIESATKGRGWRKLLILAREWSMPGVAVGLLIFGLTQWQNYTEFRVHTGDRLDQIESYLLTKRAAEVPHQVLQELGALQPKQFSAALPALQKITEQPFATVAPQPATLREVADKLKLVNEATPDYWSTVLQFIRFASAGLSPNVPPPGTAANVTLSHNTGSPGPLGFKNCVAELDGGDVGPARFENCRVRFTQNPVRFLDVSFVNCVFEMPETTTPTPYLKRASQLLLASNLQNVSIRGPV